MCGCHSVPYLDPTFEALVKIQLRFCAEAYSRMAQVQQYVLPHPSCFGNGAYSCTDIWTHQLAISMQMAIWTHAWKMSSVKYVS